MKFIIQNSLLLIVILFFVACKKDQASQLPLSQGDWERIAPIPNINGQYDFFSLMTNNNKDLIVETRPFNAPTDKYYYYDEGVDGWFLISNFKSSNSGGQSAYTFRNTPSGNLIAIERYSLNNTGATSSSDSRTAIWNLDNPAAPIKLADENIVITTSYFHANTNGDVLSCGPQGQFSQGYVATLYDNTNKTISSIDCSILGIYSSAFFNNWSFFAFGDNFMIRYDDKYYTVNKTNQTLELSIYQPNNFAFGDLDIDTDYEGKQTHLSDGTLIAANGSNKILEWKPGESQPTIYTFDNPDFNINRNWKFCITEDDKLVIQSSQKSTACPEDIIYLMEKDGNTYRYQKIVSDYSDCSTLNRCVTANNKIYGVIANTTPNFIAKIDFN